MNVFPPSTEDTTACEAVMDLSTGLDTLIDHLQTAAKTVTESDLAIDVMQDLQPVFWLVARLKN